MSHDLVLQTKIGREETLEKFLHTIGKKGTIKDPCAVDVYKRQSFGGLRWSGIYRHRGMQILVPRSAADD